MFPEERLVDPALPIGLFVLAYRVCEDDGDQPPNVLRGMRDLISVEAGTPLAQLTRRRVRAHEHTIRERGMARATRSYEEALLVSDPTLRRARVTRAERSLNRNGISRWHDFLASVRAVRVFAGDIGIHASELPDDPMTGLYGLGAALRSAAATDRVGDGSDLASRGLLYRSRAGRPGLVLRSGDRRPPPGRH